MVFWVHSNTLFYLSPTSMPILNKMKNLSLYFKDQENGAPEGLTFPESPIINGRAPFCSFLEGISNFIVYFFISLFSLGMQ